MIYKYIWYVINVILHYKKYFPKLWKIIEYF